MRRFKVCGGGNGQLFYAHERPAEQGSGGLGAGGTYNAYDLDNVVESHCGR